MNTPATGTRSSALLAAHPPRKRRGKMYYRWYVPYLFLLPGMALYLLWTVYPLFYQLYISFFNWKITPGQVSQFVGFANYQAALPTKPSGWRCATPPYTPSSPSPGR